jgi:hypothetical protein
MKNTLQQEKKKQLSPWVTLPQLAGILQASPSRNKGHLVESPLPAENQSHWLSSDHRGQTT